MGIYQHFIKNIGKLLYQSKSEKIISDRSELFRLEVTKTHRAKWGDSWYRAGVVVVDEEGRFLLVEERRRCINGVWHDVEGIWNIASGSCEEDETFIAAAHREAHEELGRGVKLKGILAIKHGKHNDDPCLLIVFLADLTDETLEFDHKEIKSQRRFSENEIYQLASQDKLRSKDLMFQVVENYNKGFILPLEIINEYQAP